MVANKDEQVMVKDIFGIDVDIYENKYDYQQCTVWITLFQ